MTDISDPEDESGLPAGPAKEARAGYRNPPKKTRFKRGQCGNRRGRPRGALDRRAIIERVANELHLVIEDGNRVRRTTLDLMLLFVRNRAMKGEPRAARQYAALLSKYCPATETRKRGGYLIVTETTTEEEWEARLTRRREGRETAQDIEDREAWERLGDPYTD